MSSNPARSLSLPPYAAPAPSELVALGVTPAISFVPFVPPTWVPGAEDDVEVEVVREGSAATEQPTEGNADLAADASDDTLPWIEAFAADPDVAEFVDRQDADVENQPMLRESGVDTDQPDAAHNAEASFPDAEDADDTWVMSEASADIAQLADELSAIAADAAPSTTPAAAAEPMQPWHDDEAWMDIMPALPNSGGRDLAAETEWARAFGEPPAPMQPPPLPTGDAQAAASSLESVARRLRAGELNVPGFHANRGDAAALAAALAALLGAND